MNSITGRPVRRALATSCLIMAVGATLATDTTPAARARRSALQGPTKVADYQRLNDLSLAIARLKERLVTEPGNTQVRGKLNTALTEYNAISAAFGGDQAVQVGPDAGGAAPTEGGPMIPPNCVMGAPESGSNMTPVAIPDSGGGPDASPRSRKTPAA